MMSRLLSGSALCLILSALPVVGAVPQGQPDFTQGGQIPENATHDWSLGATGARGWIWTEKLVTLGARQIAVTEVAVGSPAHGVLAPGDVILGIGDGHFLADPRREFGEALTRAESEAGQGRLSILRWRQGSVETVVVPIPVLGSYSTTAPFDCPKSQRILHLGCQALARRMADPSYGRQNAIPRCLNALALLASGDPEHLPLLRREARWAAKFSADAFQTWYYGYVVMFLAEYVMVTGDRAVVPGLKRLALEAARGQSVVGSWGHRLAGPDGRLFGYGMMNAPGIPLTLGLVLARAAGVQDPSVDRAIERSKALLRFYSGKGAIPYGDHAPWIETHEDNGKCGMAAVLFDLAEEADTATFFSRMSLASHGSERDTGHTGNFFNILWALPGVCRLGPEATGAWMQEYGAWSFDLARQWDGSFRHQGPPEPKPDQYGDWDATGAILLSYALPRRKLAIAGREGIHVAPAGGSMVASLVDDGRGWNNRDREAFYSRLDAAQLLGRLGSWSPVVRERAAVALSKAPDRKAVVPALVEKLGSSRLEERYGACQALAHLGSAGAAAVPALGQCLEDGDLWLRVKAAEALGRIGKPAMPALPKLLADLSRPPTPSDPRGMEPRFLCFVLFDRRHGMLRRFPEGVDLKSLHGAIRAGLSNQDGRARSAVATVYDTYPFEALQPLLPTIHQAIMEPSPSGIMFSDGVRTAGLKLLARHHIADGLDACVHYVRHMKQHGSQKRVPEVLTILLQYGAHAQSKIPELLRVADYFENEEEDFPRKLSLQKATAVRDAVAAIRAATDRPELVPMR